MGSVPVRKIIHIDMDAFFAAIEQRDNPRFAGKPLVVGGSPNRRGVVAACSYAARRYGIHSAMPSATARRLCPQVAFVKPRFDVYRGVSQQLRWIFAEYTELIEPLSLDEAYLDVTATAVRSRSATGIATSIRKRIFHETGLTASAGVSYNKFLAKIASDLNKPDGLCVITPQEGPQFVAKLPIRKLHGVGRVTEEKMHRLGISTGADLRRWSAKRLIHHFGKVGQYYHDAARGVDDRPVKPDRIRKSIGSESTFARDLHDPHEMLGSLRMHAFRVAETMVKKELTGRNVTVKTRFPDFALVTRSTTLGHTLRSRNEMLSLLPALLEKTGAVKRGVRLLGVTVSGLCPSGRGDHRQLDLLAQESGSA